MLLAEWCFFVCIGSYSSLVSLAGRLFACIGSNVMLESTQVCTRKTRILDVVYNASNNELVRTKTLVKNAIVVVSVHTL